MNLLEFIQCFLSIVNPHFGTDITHDVYQAALQIRLRIGLAASLFHANYSIRQEELYLLKAATFAAFEHFAPNLNIFSRRNRVVDYFFRTIRFDTDGDINCFALISDPLKRNIGGSEINAEELI